MKRMKNVEGFAEMVIISEEDLKKRHFDFVKEKTFPPSHTPINEGNEVMPYYPDDIERDFCGYAPAGYRCIEESMGISDGKSKVISCADCLYHPFNKAHKH
jgi:Zn-finger protein